MLGTSRGACHSAKVWIEASGFTISYTDGMVRDVGSVARSLGGEVLPGAVEVSRPVESIVPLEQFSVLGSARFATLVAAPAARLVAALTAGDERATLLRDAVLVTHGGGGALRAGVAAAGVTAIVATEPADDLVLPTVTSLLAVDQAAEERAVVAAMRVLTLAARRGGAAGVVAELAHRTDGWVVLLDRHGQVITTAGAGGLHVQDAQAVALGRPVRIRHRALQVHPVGPGEDISAQLVLAPRTETSARGRELGSQAAALIDLIMRTHDSSRTERLGRSVMMDVLLAGGSGAARLLRQLGVHEQSLSGFALASRSAGIEIERLLVPWLAELGAAQVFTEQRGVVSGFLRGDHAEEIAARVEAYSSVLYLGLGGEAAAEALERSAAEARQALEVARADARRVVRYAAIPTVAYVFDRLDDETTRRIAHLLDPLARGGVHGELTETLRVFLAANGAWGSAAATLGVHRQTLAGRIRRIETETGLSMADPDDRTAAWLALRALER